MLFIAKGLHAICAAARSFQDLPNHPSIADRYSQEMILPKAAAKGIINFRIK